MFIVEINAPVAFNAYSTITWQYGDYELVIFDSTLLKYGGHYQTHNSVFICPVHGMYAFAVNVANDGATKAIAGRIMIENLLLTGLFITRKDENFLQAGSAFDIVECFQRQRVWVRSNGAAPHSMRGDYAWSSFSAYLIHRY